MLTSLQSSLIWRWRKGFKKTSKSFFDAAHGAQGDYQSYMPDAAYWPLESTNGMMSHTLLHNKLHFEKVVGQYAPIPPTLALIVSAKVSPLSYSLQPEPRTRAAPILCQKSAVGVPRRLGPPRCTVLRPQCWLCKSCAVKVVCGRGEADHGVNHKKQPTQKGRRDPGPAACAEYAPRRLRTVPQPSRVS
jgi:hypothetical protein